MPELQRIRLWIPEPDGAYLLTLNTARGRIHWRVWAKLTGAWREQAKLEAEECELGPLELSAGRRVHIEALPVQGPGGTLADPGGHMPTLKACVDGLRDALWLPDDSGTYVSAITMLPPVRAAAGQAGGIVVDLTTMPAVVPALF
jgi:hypothetical protein